MVARREYLIYQWQKRCIQEVYSCRETEETRGSYFSFEVSDRHLFVLILMKYVVAHNIRLVKTIFYFLILIKYVKAYNIRLVTATCYVLMLMTYVMAYNIRLVIATCYVLMLMKYVVGCNIRLVTAIY